MMVHRLVHGLRAPMRDTSELIYEGVFRELN